MGMISREKNSFVQWVYIRKTISKSHCWSRARHKDNMALGISAETLISAYDGRTDGEKVEVCVLVANQLHIGMP